MTPLYGLVFVGILVMLLLGARWWLRGTGRVPRRMRSRMSARSELRGIEDAYTTMGPTIRERERRRAKSDSKRDRGRRTSGRTKRPP